MPVGATQRFSGSIRAARETDLPFLREMLYEAAGPEPGEPDPGIDAVLTEPMNAAYLEGWRRDGDEGIIALDDARKPIGAAWFRRFTAEVHGYGFLDPAIPEVAIAVDESHRGTGVGTAILQALIRRAGAAGVPALSLSVFPSDRVAVRLYEGRGFRRVGWYEDLWVMRLDLP